MIGAARTPARPPTNVLVAQTETATTPGRTPDSDAMASESTTARTSTPAWVQRSTAAPPARMTIVQA
jgi:hypothetical protein